MARVLELALFILGPMVLMTMMRACLKKNCVLMLDWFLREPENRRVMMKTNGLYGGLEGLVGSWDNLFHIQISGFREAVCMMDERLSFDYGDFAVYIPF